FAAPKEFLLVTDAKYAVKFGKNELLYQQGARLPLVDEQPAVYTVEVPTKLPNGNLHKQRINIPKISKAVHKGYLPYTTNNILRSAFRFYGMPYGWGGLKESVDCSALILNAYRTVGIYLPRNMDEQAATAGITKQLEGLDSAKKTELIKGLVPGSALYMDGHGLMYLGQINGAPYCIHALGFHYIGGSQHREM
ncbi:MAG: NlpC/P60 family protein, partial [Phascolarctobacterium sp.]